MVLPDKGRISFDLYVFCVLNKTHTCRLNRCNQLDVGPSHWYDVVKCVVGYAVAGVALLSVFSLVSVRVVVVVGVGGGGGGVVSAHGFYLLLLLLL